MGATGIVWSVGDSAGTLADMARRLARRGNYSVAGTEDLEPVPGVRKGSEAILDSEGSELPYVDAAVGSLPEGYTAQPFIRVASVC